MRRIWVILVLVFFGLGFSVSHAAETGYIEDFALAKDRAEALKQLIPGTEDYCYYHCLYYEQTGQWERYDELFKLWVEQYKDSPRITQMRYRRALLMYDREPRKSLDFIARAMGVYFNHQREIQGQKPQLPTTLDQNLISSKTFTDHALGNNPDTLNGFEDSALDWLTERNLATDRRRHLLQRLTRPDYPNMVRMVADDLDYRYSGGFGSLAIHRQMLQAQLDELLTLKPELISSVNFVNAYLAKLCPNADVDWQHDPTLRQEYLDRLWGFVEKLPPAFNSLKACVLYQRLVHDRALGTYDADRFMTYIKLPRAVAYVEPKYLDLGENRRFSADLNADYGKLIMMRPIGSDEELVRSYLLHFFVEAPSWQPYAIYIRDTWLKPLFAEAKLVNGVGDPEQWYSLMTPATVQALKDRVDLDFAYTNRTYFQPDEPVKLGVWVKNVDKLMVKVYEVNALNYYLEKKEEVNLDINLDGLVANAEDLYSYSDAPMKRNLREFPFDRLKGRGVYVVELIGGGQRSRALIRKGELRFLERSSTAGHIFQVLDEKNNLLKDATVWMGAAEYKPDKNGEIVVPYSTEPASQPIVLKRGDFATLSSFYHKAEAYQLKAGFWVDREQLLSRKEATLLVRPTLTVNDEPVTLSVLEDVKLTITTMDLDNVATAKEEPNFKLGEGRETTYPFRVPERLNYISFSLSAKVQSLSTGKKVDLGNSETFALNGIDRTEKVEDLHLLCAEGSYTLELLGKTGEVLADRPVNVTLKHRDFKEPAYASLQTDASGRVALGKLKDIVSLTASGPGASRNWVLLDDSHNYLNTIHGRVGQTLYVPYMGKEKEAVHSELSLLELRDETFQADRFAAMTVKDGFVEIKGLPRGDYDLLIKPSNTHIRIRLAEGTERLGYVLGENRQLEVINPKPLQITSVEPGKDTIAIHLANANEWTRVHVAADRYLAEYPVQSYLGAVTFGQPGMVYLSKLDSLYVAGVRIGDEYRYILERKYARKYAGNMLERPSLLLNPWSLSETQTGREEALEGELLGKGRGGGYGLAGKPLAGFTKRLGAGAETGDLEFLASSAVVLANLKPDANGVVTIKRADLGTHQDVYVFAADPMNSVYRRVTLAEPKDVKFLDLRLAEGLDPKKHFTEQKQVSVAAKGEKFTTADITTSKVETYDTLGKVYRLYVTLGEDPTLREFSFVVDWPKLSQAKKLELYSKYSCHELNFFLCKKDPKFFGEVVKPYIANKKDKTFLDRWLLGEDLSGYVTPWNFAQLNTVEQILLAQVVKDEPARVARHVKDLLEMIPPDVEEMNRLFQTALKGSSLEVAGGPAAPPAPSEAPARMRAENGRADALRAPTTAALSPVPGGVLRKRAEAAEEKAEAGKDKSAYFAADRARQAGRQLYIKLEKTKEWVENNYYHLPIEQAGADRVTVNGFWKDYAGHDGKTPFLSTHLAEAHRNFTEAMFALSVLDLPFESGEHKSESAGRSWTLTPGSSAIIFHQEIKEAKTPEGQTVMVSQNFFRASDRYRTVDNEKMEKYVTDEFLIHVVYGCQLVVTNPTSATQKLDVLMQVPPGALPVMNGQYTKSVHVDLQSYHTQTLEYYFYFPTPGEVVQFPVHVAKNETPVASASPFTFKVVAEPSKVDTESWDWISQNGTDQQVLDYLNGHNLERTDLDRIAWRMKDVNTFRQLTALLRARHVYNHTLWAYALKHDEPAEATEFLKHADGFVAQCGDYISTKLLTIDPVVRKTYQYMEYDPLVNARQHKLGPRWDILNDHFRAQYERLCRVLSYRPALDNDDLMAVTYYLLLQDRVEEALDFFKRVDPKALETRLQYDYFRVYLAFSTLEVGEVRRIAQGYEKYPVERWRKRFVEVLAELDEAEGKATPAKTEEPTTSGKQGVLAATQPSFDFKVESRKVTLDYQSLTEVTVNYYLMDIELLFSQNPFLREESGRFAYIRPNETQTMKLDAGRTQVTFEVPKAFQSSNVTVEIVGSGVRKSQAYYANSLVVQVIENYGQVRLSDSGSGKTLAKVYVKVYARMKDGSVRFYKDGYTDLRGRFDYASLSTDDLAGVEKFSLLVMSELQGAVVREAAPPKR